MVIWPGDKFRHHISRSHVWRAGLLSGGFDKRERKATWKPILSTRPGAVRMAELSRIHNNLSSVIWLLYEPHCPSPSCAGGDKNKLHYIKGNPSWLPPEVCALRKEDEILYRCAYCGLVWFQEASKRPGIDAYPVGYYDDLDHPREYVLVKGDYRIREQNTTPYWYNMGSKRRVPRTPKYGGVD